MKAISVPSCFNAKKIRKGTKIPHSKTNIQPVNDLRDGGRTVTNNNNVINIDKHRNMSITRVEHK